MGAEARDAVLPLGWDAVVDTFERALTEAIAGEGVRGAGVITSE